MGKGKDQAMIDHGNDVIAMNGNHTRNDVQANDQDVDNQDLLRALEQGEIPFDYFEQEENAFNEVNVHSEFPATATEKSAEVQGIVEAMVGVTTDEDEELNEDEKLNEELTYEASVEQVIATPEELPDMEIKAKDVNAGEVGEEVFEIGESSSQNEVDYLKPEEDSLDKITLSDANDNGQDNGSAEVEGKQNKEFNGDESMQQQPMVQTNLAGGVGHALGSVINSVFTGIGMALGSSIEAAKQTKEALSIGPGLVSNSSKYEAGAHVHFNPAEQAVNDSFNEDVVNVWKQSRIDGEFASLQMDMDAHLRSVDKLNKTEWAQRLNSIENSGDREMMENAPAILSMAKAKTDFKDADRDMSYFLEHIQQRSERLASMAKDSGLGAERLDAVVKKWQEDANRRLEDLTDSTEKQGFVDKIQDAAQGIVSGLRSIFSRSPSIA